MRYADGSISQDGRLIVCVLERHEPEGEIFNELVSLESDGSRQPLPIHTDKDFYASPRINASGDRIAWLSWNHPHMPWDGTELWVANLHADGSISKPIFIAGGSSEWINNPEWGPDGKLYFLSDRSNWSILYAWEPGKVETVTEIMCDISRPAFALGYTRFTFLSEGRIVVVYWRDGVEYLGLVERGSKTVQPIEVPFSAIPYLASDGVAEIWFIGGSFKHLPSIVRLQIDHGEPEIVYTNVEHSVPQGYISTPEAITFPTNEGEVAHALYYPPINQDFKGPESERPPLIVRSHGGPTSSARPYLQFEIQYFTSRGIAFVDVNYRGSTGYGRTYREKLKGKWGIVDAVDCVNAARFLVQRGDVDGSRLMKRGGSAGGWTTVCALTYHDVFQAGASYYGIADAEALTRVTHKFEERYLDSLIGPYPQEKALYQERSPIHHTQQLSCPVILFQGSEDKVVPPVQSEAMIEALEAKGLPYAYLFFEGEGHGFRLAETVRRSLEAEIYFYAHIFGFDLAEPVEPIEIHNLK